MPIWLWLKKRHSCYRDAKCIPICPWLKKEALLLQRRLKKRNETSKRLLPDTNNKNPTERASQNKDKVDYSKFIPSRPLTRSQAKELLDAHLAWKKELAKVETRKSLEKVVLVMACEAEDVSVKRPVPGDNTIGDMPCSEIQHRGQAIHRSKLSSETLYFGQAKLGTRVRCSNNGYEEGHTWTLHAQLVAFLERLLPRTQPV